MEDREQAGEVSQQVQVLTLSFGEILYLAHHGFLFALISIFKSKFLSWWLSYLVPSYILCWFQRRKLSLC